MKNLFFVSVAVGIFSGTSSSAFAQKSINSVKVSEIAKAKGQPKFIEDIEIKPDAQALATPVVNKTIVTTAVTPLVTTVASMIESCSNLQFKYAQLLNADVESIKNLSLFGFIENWWSTRYRYGGTTKEGIDCSAYCGELFRNVFNINLPRTARDQYAACEKIKREDLEEGDLVFFNTRGGVSHVGVYLGNNYFTHSSVSNGVTISSLDDAYYSRKFIAGGRYVAAGLVVE